jgi:hypothetical protein
MAVEVNMPVITASGEEAVVTAWFERKKKNYRKKNV